MKDRIRKFIIDRLMKGEGELDDGESLVEKGVLDSFGFIELIGFIEHEFGIKIKTGEILIDRFDSVKDICGFLRGKQTGHGKDAQG